MRNDLTIIYYTSNREKPEFEEKIKQTLLETIGDLPLISVSQKPIDFGQNICIGDVGVSEINCRRQFLMGAIEAKTKYVCATESDFIYPKEYFDFVPPKDDVIYLAMRVYVLFNQGGKKRVFAPKPRGCEGAMVVERDYIINRLQFVLKNAPQWGKKIENDRVIPHLLKISNHKYFILSIPAITFKTDNNMHRKTPYIIKEITKEIPHWGNAYELVEKYS